MPFQPQIQYNPNYTGQRDRSNQGDKQHTIEQTSMGERNSDIGTKTPRLERSSE